MVIKINYLLKKMALSGDHVQQILLDSTYRNRKTFPFPTEFESTVKPDNSPYPNDPVALGYIIHKDTVGLSGYDNTTSPNRIHLTTGISDYDNKILGKYIEIADPTTFLLKGVSIVAGFSNDNPHSYIYTYKPIQGVVAGDIVFIRQISSTPLLRINPSSAVLAGATSFQFAGGSKKENAYRGMYIRKVNGTLGIDHRISSYDVSTSPPTITVVPAIEAGGYATTDFIEVYNTQDNECGLSTIGSIANRGIPVNHEIRLEWLRVPRHPLYVNNLTDSVASLPINVNSFSYLIVEFKNKSHGSSGVIQSNNKSIKKAQFLVPIEDLSTGVGKFYTLRSQSSIVINYNPNDTIYFSIKTPSGLPICFDPEDEDPNSLMLPNPDMQVSALFSIRRLLM